MALVFIFFQFPFFLSFIWAVCWAKGEWPTGLDFIESNSPI